MGMKNDVYGMRWTICTCMYTLLCLCIVLICPHYHVHSKQHFASCFTELQLSYGGCNSCGTCTMNDHPITDPETSGFEPKNDTLV